MTRPGGTVPVKLARHRARAMAEWLAGIEPLEPTLLAPVCDTIESRRALLASLARRLSPPVGRGRRRKPVSTYFLPRDELRQLDNGYFVLRVPPRLRAVVRAMLRAMRNRKGVKMSIADKLRNARNGNYDPETRRKYHWLARRAEARRVALENALRAMPRPDPRGEGYAVLAAYAMHRRFILPSSNH